MGKLLSEPQIEAYHRDGYGFPFRAMGPEEMAPLLGHAEALEQELGERLVDHRSKIHLLSTALSDLVRHPAILDAVEDVIGPHILCWNTHFFTKEAGSGEHVAWHQDGTYWGLDSTDVVSAWVAFTESNEANGAMRVVPGTHRGRMALPRMKDQIGGLIRVPLIVSGAVDHHHRQGTGRYGMALGRQLSIGFGQKRNQDVFLATTIKLGSHAR